MTEPTPPADLSFIATTPEATRRWDREWLQYLSTESPKAHLATFDRLEIARNAASKLATKSAREVHGSVLAAGYSTLAIWVEGAALVGKRVLEIGCGCGYLGKQLGAIAAGYLGLDHSRFALHVGELTSPDNCVYAHLSDFDRIREHAGTMDTMVARYFFIHQNFASASWVLRLAAYLLKRGGRIGADFWLTNPKAPRGVVHPALHDLDSQHPSCAFEFTLPQIAELARVNGFELESQDEVLAQQRRFVTLRKP